MAWALLFVAIPGLFIFASVFLPVLEFSAVGPGLSIVLLGLSTTIFRLFASTSASIFMPKSFTPIFLSTLMSASVLMLGLSTPMPKLSSLSASLYALVFGLSPLFFPVLSLPKTPILNLAIRRQKLDNTISR